MALGLGAAIGISLGSALLSSILNKPSAEEEGALRRQSELSAAQVDAIENMLRLLGMTEERVLGGEGQFAPIFGLNPQELAARKSAGEEFLLGEEFLTGIRPGIQQREIIDMLMQLAGLSGGAGTAGVTGAAGTALALGQERRARTAEGLGDLGLIISTLLSKDRTPPNIFPDPSTEFVFGGTPIPGFNP